MKLPYNDNSSAFLALLALRRTPPTSRASFTVAPVCFLASSRPILSPHTQTQTHVWCINSSCHKRFTCLLCTLRFCDLCVATTEHRSLTRRRYPSLASLWRPSHGLPTISSRRDNLHQIFGSTSIYCCAPGAVMNSLGTSWHVYRVVELAWRVDLADLLNRHRG